MQAIHHIVRSLPLVLTGKSGYGAFSHSDWENFVRLLHYHGMAPLFMSARQDAGIELPRDVEARLKKTVQRSVAAAMHKVMVLEAVHRISLQNHIRVVPFKGAALSQMLCDSPFLRPSVDIDLLIEAADEKPLKSLLLQSGAFEFGNLQGPVAESLMHHSRPLIYNKVAIELHTRLFPPEMSMPPVLGHNASKLASVDINGINYPSLGANPYFFYLCYHAHHHLVTGRARLLWFTDIALHLEKYFNNSADGLLSEQEVPKNIIPPVASILNLVKTHLNNTLVIGSHISPTPDWAHDEGLFLKQLRVASPDTALYYKNTLQRLTTKQKIRYTANVLFPSLDFIKTRYKVSNPFIVSILLVFNPLRALYKSLALLLKKRSTLFRH